MEELKALEVEGWRVKDSIVFAENRTKTSVPRRFWTMPIYFSRLTQVIRSLVLLMKHSSVQLPHEGKNS